MLLRCLLRFFVKNLNHLITFFLFSFQAVHVLFFPTPQAQSARRRVPSSPGKGEGRHEVWAQGEQASSRSSSRLCPVQPLARRRPPRGSGAGSQQQFLCDDEAAPTAHRSGPGGEGAGPAAQDGKLKEQEEGRSQEGPKGPRHLGSPGQVSRRFCFFFAGLLKDRITDVFLF